MKKILLWITAAVVAYVGFSWFSPADSTSAAIWIIGIVAAVVVAMVAIATAFTLARRRSRSGNTPSKKGDEKPEKVTKDKHHDSGSHGHGHGPGNLKAFIAQTIVVVLGILVVMYLLVAAVHWLFGAGTLPNQPSLPGRVVVTSNQTSSAPARSASKEAKDLIQAERDRISSEDHVLRFRYGEVQEWIHVPDGGFVTDLTVDDSKVVGQQCSSSEEKPPVDAKGPDYECHTGTIAHWVRFSAWSEDEGLVTVHYRFRYAF